MKLKAAFGDSSVTGLVAFRKFRELASFFIGAVIQNVFKYIQNYEANGITFKIPKMETNICETVP
jgi:hypothetical protein